MSSTQASSATQPYVAACPVGCNALLLETDILLPEGPLRRCAECGQLVSRIGEQRYRESMAQFDTPEFNQPSPVELQRRYSIARKRLARVSRMLDKPPEQIRVVDVGCSRGQFLQIAAKLGFEAEGVEPAPSVARAAQASGLSVHQGMLEDLQFPAETFDAVTLFEVVEHLRDPGTLLAECHRILKPGGILVLSTGNSASWTASVMGARWDYLHIAVDAGHISFFNPRSIARLAARTGFSVERIETARVKFYEKADVARWIYAAAKLAAEALNIPARIAGRGHDMLCYLRRG